MLFLKIPLNCFVVCILFLSSEVTGRIYFQEEFSDGGKWQDRWILSEHPSRKWGFFILSAGKFYGHQEESKGVQTFQDGLHYGMSAKFPPFSNKGKTLVIQYTVKNEQALFCGGGYIKLFNCSLQPSKLNEKTPYLLMFGPDVCVPKTFKTHVIFNYQGKYVEIKKGIYPPDDILTHLYTLIIYPDNTYSVKIDNKDMANGKLKTDGDFLPPEEIVDYKAKKPKYWDDNPFIDDPHDQKSEDWDQPEFIPDLMAKKPEDWYDNLDGEWEPPLIENPDFKGIWKPRRISNPNYMGPWVRPKIRNPKFSDDLELYKFDEICAVGFDIWQAQAGTIFDNILITNDAEFAEEHAWIKWGSLRDAEKEMMKNLKLKKRAHHIHDEL